MRALRAFHRSPAGCALIVGLLLMTAVAARAQVGGMLVAPTRIVFEGDVMSAALTLVNRGQTTETYRVSFVQRRMDEDGRFETATDIPAGTPPGADSVLSERFADNLIAFSPRVATLAPGQQQTIRLQLRKQADLPAGEYRSHLLIQAVPETGSLDVERLLGAPAEQQSGLALQLTPVYGLTLPVIVRHGVLSAEVQIADIHADVTEDKPALFVRLLREGDRSVFGNVVIDLVEPNGRETNVGLVNGIAVYTPNTFRTVVVPLHMPDRGVTPEAQIRVRYIDREQAERAIVLAEAVVDVTDLLAAFDEDARDRLFGVGMGP